MIREWFRESLECRGLDPAQQKVAPGGVVVVFPDAAVNSARGGEGPEGNLVGELEAWRSGQGAAGLLVVLPPDGSVNLTALADGVAPPWDVIRSDATVEEWRLRTERLAEQVDTLAELEDLRFRATHDDRTGLLRPAEFEARLREQFSAARRQGHDLSLVLIDLDRFGAINKEFDHVAGDRVIERVARGVAEQLRDEDIAGRLGGDEFAVALPFTGPEKAARVVERLRRGILDVSGPLEGASRPVRVSGSLGFETYPGPGLTSVEGLRGHAELALRAAKRSGGDRGVFYRLLSEPGEVSSNF